MEISPFSTTQIQLRMVEFAMECTLHILILNPSQHPSIYLSIHFPQHFPPLANDSFFHLAANLLEGRENILAYSLLLLIFAVCYLLPVRSLVVIFYSVRTIAVVFSEFLHPQPHNCWSKANTKQTTLCRPAEKFGSGEIFAICQHFCGYQCVCTAITFACKDDPARGRGISVFIALQWNKSHWDFCLCIYTHL